MKQYWKPLIAGSIAAVISAAALAILSPDARSAKDPTLDEVPSFISSIPKYGVTANDVILHVTVLTFLSEEECRDSTGLVDPATSRQTAPTTFALAKVNSVLKGTFADTTIMVCNYRTSHAFSVGDSGHVLGHVSRNGKKTGRLETFETIRQAVGRRRSEGAICVWTYCIGPIIPHWNVRKIQ